jgi:hypothetical protein
VIDIPATLDPASGIALRYAVTPPHDGDPLWSSAVELQPVDGFEGIVGSLASAGSGGSLASAGSAGSAGSAAAGCAGSVRTDATAATRSGTATAIATASATATATATATAPAGSGAGVGDLPLSARFAGASGTSRIDALLRGAGEAVERRALHPSAAHPQVRAALRAPRGQGDTGRPASIVTEHDRLRHMLSRTAYESVRDWVAGFRDPDPLPAPSPARDLTAEEIRRALTADDAGLLVVDLTPRLPSAVAAMAWHVVKVLAPGYQSLRMDETHLWSWHLPRLASAPERTGCAAGLDDPREAAPHPLP